MQKFVRIVSVISLLIFLRTGFALAADQVYFYYTDPVGTPLAMSDSTGAMVWQADYMPFGEELLDTTTVENNKMFVGKEKDGETGFYYFGARYMESTIGRFISPDPIGPVDPGSGKINEVILLDPQRTNYYAYSLNNPYRYVDPDGKNPAAIAAAVAIIMLAELMFPQTMESPYEDSFLDQHWFTIATLGIGGAANAELRFAQSGLAQASQTLFRATIPAARLAHIYERHAFESAAINAGKFAKNADIKSLIQQALRSGESLIKPNTMGRAGYIVEHTFGDMIGMNAAGQFTNRIRVVVTEAAEVWTAFPF